LVRWHTCILHQLFNGSNVHKFFLMVRISVFSFVQVEFFRGPTLSLSNDSVLLLQTVFINVKKKSPLSPLFSFLLPLCPLSPLLIPPQFRPSLSGPQILLRSSHPHSRPHRRRRDATTRGPAGRPSVRASAVLPQNPCSAGRGGCRTDARSGRAD
jgi:hypothetical protein